MSDNDEPVDDEPYLRSMTPPELTKEYLDQRRSYRELCRRAGKVSRGSAGIYVESNRLAFAAILFTRLCVIAKSIERLLPDCKPKEHWDFSSVASLARNLSESYLWYYWLCEDDVDADVRQGRFVLLYCHDHGSRGRIFSDSPPPPEDDETMKDLVARFDSNPFLKTYNEKARREALRGQKTPFVQDDVLDRMGADKEDFRTYYRFFSEHTHNGPISFYRMTEHDRGCGVETMHEKRYMIMAITFAHSILARAIAGHLKLFPDAETRTPSLTDADVVRNVERAQHRWR